MPEITKDSIRSNTKYITMSAYIDDPIPEQPDREWYLAIHVSGMHVEFVPSEGLLGYMFTKEEAIKRIEEFEQTMKAEKHEYVQTLTKKLIESLER